MSALSHIWGSRGGPAFPIHVPSRNGSSSETFKGMDLRDYFAAKALQGYLASMAENVEPVEVASTIAEDCYKLADAMLDARQGVRRG